MWLLSKKYTKFSAAVLTTCLSTGVLLALLSLPFYVLKILGKFGECGNSDIFSDKPKLKMLDNRRGVGDLMLNRSHPRDASEWGQGKAALKLLNFKNNGVFFEAGAYDGEFFSNSLILEMKYNWTGILVEAVPQYFQKLVHKNRKACLVESCISTRPWHQKSTLYVSAEGDPFNEVSSVLNGFLPLLGPLEKSKELQVDCFPIYDILSACDVKKIDIMFLDIQGAELEMLMTVPWHYVEIQVIVVEVSGLHKATGKGKEKAVLRQMTGFLNAWGFELVHTIKHDYFYQNVSKYG